MNSAVTHQARFGPWLILRKLGEGAMSKVYLARHSGPESTGEEVALKVLRREYSQQQEVMHLLKQEAVIGQKMRHPNVVAAREFGEIDGLPYLAMDYIQGVTIADLLEMTEDDGTGLPPELVAVLMVQICDGLSYAHNLRDLRGKRLAVIDRDLKPGNVMVALSGVAKVMDFGVAKVKLFGGHDTEVRKTRGTPAYMSPEQARGEVLTHHSDIFGAGLLLYEMVTGVRPFMADNLTELILKIQEANLDGLVARMDEHALGLGRIFRRATEIDPLRRYPDATWMREDLQQIFPPDTPIPPPVQGAGDSTQYYTLPDQEVEVAQIASMPVAPPRMLSMRDESIDEEIELDDLESIDPDTLPELDLEDESIPEVDLGPPVFLELQPKPDPKVPASTDTLSHLTQFLIEVDS